MKALLSLLDRLMPSFDTALTLACLVWGAIALGLIGAAIVFCP